MTKAEKLTKDIRSQFSLIQRFTYNIRKHWFLVLLVVGSVYLLTQIDPALQLMTMLIESVARISVGVLLAEGFWKFRMGKLGLQTQIEDGNIAAALVFLAFLLAAVSA